MHDILQSFILPSCQTQHLTADPQKREKLPLYIFQVSVIPVGPLLWTGIVLQQLMKQIQSHVQYPIIICK